MKNLIKLAKSEEAMELLKEVQELERCFEAKSFTIYEEKIHKEKEKEYLKRIVEIIKEVK